MSASETKHLLDLCRKWTSLGDCTLSSVERETYRTCSDDLCAIVSHLVITDKSFLKPDANLSTEPEINPCTN